MMCLEFGKYNRKKKNTRRGEIMTCVSDIVVSVVNEVAYVYDPDLKKPRKIELFDPGGLIQQSKNRLTLRDLQQHILSSDYLKKGGKILGQNSLEYLMQDSSTRKIRIYEWEGISEQPDNFRILFLPSATSIGTFHIPFLEWSSGYKLWQAGATPSTTTLHNRHRVPIVLAS